MKIRYILFLLIIVTTFTIHSKDKRQNVEVGVFVEDIYSIDYQNSKYQIIFWLWVNSNDEVFNFEKDLDLSNCAEIEISSVLYDSISKKRKFHSECKIRATILNPFNVVNYPFDLQRINLRMELTKYTDIKSYNLIFDKKSKLSPELIQDWKVASTYANHRIKNYDSNFGDLESKDPIEFPGIDIEINLKRDSWSLFFKSFLTLFVSIILASISLFYPNNCSEEKMGLIVGSLFTTVGNKYVTDGFLPLTNFNLSDKLHLLTIVLITIIALYAIVEQRLRVKDNFKLDILSFSISFLSFTIGVAYFTYSAMQSN
jgi:hypothetical protein